MLGHTPCVSSFFGPGERSTPIPLAIGLGVAVVVQESLTVYPQSDLGQHLLWGAVWLFLVAAVARGSVAPWLLLTVFALVGAVTFVVLGLDDPDAAVRAFPLALAYVSQLVLLGLVLRTWRRGPAASPGGRSGSPVR